MIPWKHIIHSASNFPVLKEASLYIFLSNGDNVDLFELKADADESLILYHTILTFNNPIEEAFWKHCGKRRKCW